MKDAVSKFEVSRSTVSRILKKVRHVDDHLGAAKSLKKSYKGKFGDKMVNIKNLQEAVQKFLCPIEAQLDLLKKLLIFLRLLCTGRCIDVI